MKNPALTRWRGLLPAMFCIAILISSCGDELLDTSEYEISQVVATPDFSLPLAFGELGLSDLLKDSTYIRVYPDGLLYLTYEDTQEILDIRELLLFADRTFHAGIQILPAFFPPTQNEVVQSSVDIDRDLNFPQSLTEVAFKETTTIELSLDFDPVAYDFFEVEVVLPTFIKDGTPFTARVGYAQPLEVSLEGYVAAMEDNVFPMRITLIEKPHTSNETVVVPTTVTVTTAFHEFDFEYIRGFFGEIGPINISEQVVDIDAFGDALGEAEVSFANPQFTFSIISDLGLPVTIGFTPLEARKKSGEVLPIEFTVPNPVQIQAPTVLGDVAQTDIGIANLGAIFDFAPEQLAYGLSIGVNEGITDGVNFMHDTSSLRIKLHAELPIYGRASNIMLSDTFDIDLTDAEETQVLNASLRIRAENELPLDAFLQVYFADEDGIVSDSLFAQGNTNVIKASSVTAAGELQEAGRVDLSISLDEQKLKRLFESKKMIVRATMNTSREASGNQHHVQFKSGYKINMALGFQAKLKLESAL